MTVASTGAELLVECLRLNGVRQAFGVPGESYLAVLDALYDVRAEIPFLVCRQEGGAAYMAEAYGKLTGEPGICFVTRGPGATNASIGVHTAMQNSTPMILFVGQVGTDCRGREAFQEIDYRAFFGSICKWVTEIDDAARVPEIVSRAFSVATSGRPGPVVVALPEDMLDAKAVATACAATPIRPPVASGDTIDEVVRLLERAERPLLLAGGGGWNEEGRRSLNAFAGASGVPALSAFRFNDLLDNHSDYYVGDAGVGISAATRELLQRADVVVALGVRLGEMTTASYTLFECPVPSQTLIHVASSAAELGKVYQPHMAINSCANAFAGLLEQRSLAPQHDWSAWRSGARAEWMQSLQAPPQQGGVDMGQIMHWLREHLPSDVILTNGAGNFTVWPNKFYAFGAGSRLLAPQSGAMGYGIPAAVAAKARYPQRLVVCFAGDGDFQMTCQELGSAVQAGVQPVVLVLNNSMYGTIRMHQERTYPERISGTAIVNPDFVQFAQAYGYYAQRITRTEDFAAAFARASESASGGLLELVIDSEILTPHLTVAQARAAAADGG